MCLTACFPHHQHHPRLHSSQGQSEPEPCPPGTFGSLAGLRSSAECSLCSGGSYCDGYGLTNPRGLCAPGFFCQKGSSSSMPDFSYDSISVSVIGGICPKGHYCGMGTVLPVRCPIGTFSDQNSSQSSHSCQSCPPGFVCASEGLTAPTGLCPDGYTSPGGAAVCVLVPRGYYQSPNTTAVLACPQGSFSIGGATFCEDCPPGS